MSRRPEQQRLIHAFQARIKALTDARKARIETGKMVDDLNKEIADLRTRLIVYMGALQFLLDEANTMPRTKKERAALEAEANKQQRVVRDVEAWAETNLRQWFKEAV